MKIASCPVVSLKYRAVAWIQDIVHTQGWRKQFYIGQARSLDTLNIWKRVAIHRHKINCMKHNQQAKHANARGSQGCSPKTIDTVRLNLGAFQDSTITISASYPIIMIIQLQLYRHKRTVIAITHFPMDVIIASQLLCS